MYGMDSYRGYEADEPDNKKNEVYMKTPSHTKAYIENLERQIDALEKAAHSYFIRQEMMVEEIELLEKTLDRYAPRPSWEHLKMTIKNKKEH